MRNRNSTPRPVARVLLVATLTAVALLLNSCGLGGRGGVDEARYSGTWKGTVMDEAHGAGTFVATLEQQDLSIVGTWHSVMGGDSNRQNGGSWTGNVFVGASSDLVEVTLSPAVASDCSYRLTLSREQQAMRGNYAAVADPAACSNLTRGTLQLEKQ